MTGDRLPPAREVQALSTNREGHEDGAGTQRVAAAGPGRTAGGERAPLPLAAVLVLRAALAVPPRA